MSDGAPRGPLFLERRSYRRRRLADAGRVLPVAGLVLFLLPLYWRPQGGETAGTAITGVYFFAVWLVLIIGAALLSRALMKPEPRRDDTPPEAEPGDAGA